MTIEKEKRCFTQVDFRSFLESIEDVWLEAARRLLSSNSFYKPSEIIYQAITSRFADVNDKVRALDKIGADKIYRQNIAYLQSLLRSAGYFTKITSWLHVTIGTGAGHGVMHGEYHVIPKLYYTLELPDDPREAFKRTLSFMQRLSLMSDALAKEIHNCQWKIPSSMDGMILTQDTLVVHLPELYEKAEEIINNSLHGITLHKRLRPNRGFDIRKGNNVLSHSEAMSRFLAKVIEKDKRILQMPLEKLADWLRESVRKMAETNYRHIPLHALNDINFE